MNYNQYSITATTSSPYFTAEVVDNACFNCANEIGSPASFSSQCDICKTLTISEIHTFNWFDTILLFLIPFTIIYVIGLFRRKK